MKLELFKLLSCKTRFDIMKMLIINQTICVCHIESHLELSQANVSKHMAIFRKHNIVKSEKNGKSVYYSLCPKFSVENKLLLDYIIKGEKDEEYRCIC